jgi:hypothetical protein
MPLDSIDVLITDSSAPQDIISDLRSRNLQVVIAEDKFNG